MLTALFFAFKPYFNGLDAMIEDSSIYFENLNLMLIFMGLGISFSSLQDTSRTQNNFSRKIYEDPKKGKIFIFIIIFMIVVLLMTGLVGFFSIEDKIINEVSVGLMIMGLSMFGFLKAAVEMFEKHRLDKTN